MAESAILLVDEVFPAQPVRQWALSFPYPLRFLFASRPEVISRVLGVVYGCIGTHVVKKAGSPSPRWRRWGIWVAEAAGGNAVFMCRFRCRTGRADGRT